MGALVASHGQPWQSQQEAVADGFLLKNPELSGRGTNKLNDIFNNIFQLSLVTCMLFGSVLHSSLFWKDFKACPENQALAGW